MKILIAIFMLAALGQVAPLKLIKHSQSTDSYRAPLFLPQPAYLYPVPSQPLQGESLATEYETERDLGTKGGSIKSINKFSAPQTIARPFPGIASYQPSLYAPQPLAYVIVRPIHAAQYPYGLGYEQNHYYRQEQQAYQTDAGFYGLSPTRDPSIIQQQHEPDTTEQPSTPPPQPDDDSSSKGGKLLKLKNSLDKFAASALSRLAFSSYQVDKEEYMTPPPPPPPPQPSKPPTKGDDSQQQKEILPEQEAIPEDSRDQQTQQEIQQATTQELERPEQQSLGAKTIQEPQKPVLPQQQQLEDSKTIKDWQPRVPLLVRQQQLQLQQQQLQQQEDGFSRRGEQVRQASKNLA